MINAPLIGRCIDALDIRTMLNFHPLALEWHSGTTWLFADQPAKAVYAVHSEARIMG
jgi:hypothetical protein